jgi:hypothetical protein
MTAQRGCADERPRLKSCDRFAFDSLQETAQVLTYRVVSRPITRTSHASDARAESVRGKGGVRQSLSDFTVGPQQTPAAQPQQI